MIGPEWVAQQKKFVASRTTNCGERNAWPSEMSSAPAPASDPVAFPLASAGARLTSSDAGIMMIATTAATICMVVRQSCQVTSHATSGDMVSGAMPMPAETSDTARLRWLSNQPVTHAIIGAKIAAVAPPTKRPNRSWNSINEVAQLASARLAAITIEPVSTTGRGPTRSDSVPQIMLPKAIARKPIVIALDMPATDQPVSRVIG